MTDDVISGRSSPSSKQGAHAVLSTPDLNEFRLVEHNLKEEDATNTSEAAERRLPPPFCKRRFFRLEKK